MDLNPRRAGGALGALLVTLLAAGWSTPARAADGFQTFLAERSLLQGTLPEIRQLTGSPFAAKGANVHAHLSRRGADVLLQAACSGQETMTVKIYRGRFPTPAEIRERLARREGWQLPTETRGEPVFERKVRYRKDFLAAWEQRLDGVRKNPQLLLNRWARKNPQLNPDGYWTGGLDQNRLTQSEKTYSGVRHQISTSYLNVFARDRSDPLNPQGYGSPHDGYRARPWIAFRPTYVMRYETEVELEEPGVYVVVAEGEHGSQKTSFLFSELDGVIRRDGNHLHLQAVSRGDGSPLSGTKVHTYFQKKRQAQVNLSPFQVGKRQPWFKNPKRVQKLVQEIRAGPRKDVETRDLQVDAAGFLRVEVPASEQTWLVLERGGHYHFLSGSGFQDPEANQGEVLVHLTADRQVYKPGETIRFRGVARRLVGGEELSVLKGSDVQVNFGWSGQVTTKVELSEHGTFHGELELPRDQRTGSFQLQAQLPGVGGHGQLSLQVLAYRKPEHEVLVEAAEPWVVQGEEGAVRLHGRFTVGGNLSDAKVRWRIRPQGPSASDHGATVAGRGEGGGWSWRDQEKAGGPRTNGNATLDERGRYTVEIPLPELDHDYSVKLDATVISPDGREVHGSTSFYAPRSLLALGLKSNMSLVEDDEDWVVLARSMDLEGKSRGATVDLTLQRRRWERVEKRRGGVSWVERIDPIKNWQETIPASGKAQWEIPMPLAGNIELLARATDAAGRRTSTKVTTYRYGKDAPWWRWDRLELSADKPSYAPGETARVLLRCPLQEGVAWWSLEGRGLKSRGKVEVAGFNAKIEVPITAGDHPQATLHVEVVKNGQHLQKDLEIEVPAVAKQAEVILETPKRVYQPGDTVTVSVEARSHRDEPLAGEFCLAVVDQALEQIAPDHTPDPYETFYGTRRNRVHAFGGHYGMYAHRGMMAFGGAEMELSDGMAMESMAAPMMKSARAMPQAAGAVMADRGSGGGGGGIKIRSEFRDVAFWVGAVQTDSRGRGTVTFQLPDDLARWKLVAYWVDDATRVAKSVHRVTARKDLMVRLGLPRFLTTGDHILIKASVQNVSDQDRSGSLTFETKGAAPVPLGKQDLETLGIREDPKSGWLLGPSGPVKRAPDQYQLTIGAQGHDAVDFPIYVHGYPASGEMTFESIFDSQGTGDGLRKSIPVVPFARRRTEVTVHPIEDRTRIAVEEREGTFRQATEVAVDLMLNLEQAVETNLVDDLTRLISYRYGCTEQTLSRFVPLATAYAGLGEKWLTQAGVERAGELEAILAKGVERLQQLRNGAGWGWSPGDQASTSVTAYVISRIYGLPEPYRSRLVKELELPRAVQWLARLFRKNSKQALTREERENDAYRLLAVYRAYEALALAGQKLPTPRVAKVASLKGDPRFWTCYGNAKLANGDERGARKAARRLDQLSEGDQAFHYWKHQGERYSWYADDTETTGLVLEFFQRLQAAGLEVPESYRTGLRWMAIGPGTAQYRSTKARAVAASVAATHLGERPPRGRQGAAQVVVEAGREHRRTVSPQPRAPRQRVLVKAPELVRAQQVVDIRKSGGPKLLARMETTRYEKGPFQAEDNGFAVRSRVETQGTVHPSHESFQRVVEFTVPETRRYALLEVPLISGAEVPVKGEDRPALWRKSSNGRWHKSWQQVDVLDDRVVFYWQYLSPGDYKVEVTMTPEIAGYHNMLPARIFLMYFPHVEGSSESHRIQIGRKGE